MAIAGHATLRGGSRATLRIGAMATLPWAIAMLVVAALVLVPMYHVVASSVAGVHGISLENYARVFRTPRFVVAMGNSLLLGVVSSFASMLLGAPIAWLVSRSDMPLRRAVRVLVLASFAVPAFVNALSWVLLAGPNAGALNKAWMALAGTDRRLHRYLLDIGNAARLHGDDLPARIHLHA